MGKSNIMIRLEKKEEHQKVENLVRESFWNVYRPGCLEHYVLHQLRNDPAFVPELDFVMYPLAAKIVAEETDKMIIATKQLFYAMEVHKLLHFTNPDMSAVSFAMTIHGLMDYELDQSNGKCSYETDKNLLEDYLKWFCEENSI